jgi:hypothetical protein
MKRRAIKILNKPETEVTCGNKSVENQEEYEDNHYLNDKQEIANKKNPVFIVMKYLMILLVFLPWILQISNRIRKNDIFPKLQEFIEESFLCPPPIYINNTSCNCNNTGPAF